MCPFDYTAVAVIGKVVRTLTSLTTPVGLTDVTSIDRPKSVRSHSVIEDLCGVYFVVTMLFGFFCACRGVILKGVPFFGRRNDALKQFVW